MEEEQKPTNEVSFGIVTSVVKATGTTITTTNARPLPSYFDLLLENDVVRSMELERASIQESKKSGYELTKKIAEFNLLLGQKDKTIEMLLETPTDNPNFYRDSLKAAVVAATISPDSFKNTVQYNLYNSH